jgi:hypothetical protein
MNIATTYSLHLYKGTPNRTMLPLPLPNPQLTIFKNLCAGASCASFCLPSRRFITTTTDHFYLKRLPREKHYIRKSMLQAEIRSSKQERISSMYAACSGLVSKTFKTLTTSTHVQSPFFYQRLLDTCNWKPIRPMEHYTPTSLKGY